MSCARVVATQDTDGRVLDTCTTQIQAHYMCKQNTETETRTIKQPRVGWRQEVDVDTLSSDKGACAGHIKCGSRALKGGTAISTALEIPWVWRYRCPLCGYGSILMIFNIYICYGARVGAFAQQNK
jgi:hypothetical protein